MSRNVKISMALVALLAVVIAAVAIASGGGDDEGSRAAATTQAAPPATTESAPAPAETTPDETTDDHEGHDHDQADGDETDGSGQGSAIVVAGDPRTLGRPGNSGVTFTEFLDFECPACGAAYPLIEQLRQEYAGRVTFNVRYFPLPGHRNAMPAAIAAEAAHRQGKFEAMYAKLFETQREWGGQERSQARTFRGFARELGLDMAAYDAAVKAPATRKRVERDVAAGEALKLAGTPSFFVNEQPFSPQSADDLRARLDAALAGEPAPADVGPTSGA